MKKLLLSCFALVCLCPMLGLAQDRLELVFDAGILAAHAADYATTKVALGQGARELSPLSRALLVREPGAAGMKAGIAVGEMVLVHQLLKHPRTRKLGVIVVIISIAVPATLAIHNGRQLR